MRVRSRNHNRSYEMIFLWHSINRSMSVFRIDYGSCDTSSVKARSDQTWRFESKKASHCMPRQTEETERKTPRTIEKWFMFCVIHKMMINRLLPFVAHIQMSLFIYLRSALAANNCLWPFFFSSQLPFQLTIFIFILFHRTALIIMLFMIILTDFDCHLKSATCRRHTHTFRTMEFHSVNRSTSAEWQTTLSKAYGTVERQHFRIAFHSHISHANRPLYFKHVIFAPYQQS